MEALFSDFHVGDVGVGVVGDCFSRLSGCFIVAWVCHACNVGGLLPELRNRKKPCKPVFTGRGRRCGGGGGLAWPSVWSFGCVTEV